MLLVEVKLENSYLSEQIDQLLLSNRILIRQTVRYEELNLLIEFVDQDLICLGRSVPYICADSCIDCRCELSNSVPLDTIQMVPMK